MGVCVGISVGVGLNGGVSDGVTASGEVAVRAGVLVGLMDCVAVAEGRTGTWVEVGKGNRVSPGRGVDVG